MDLVAAVRRWILREHEEEHRAVDAHLHEADAQLTEMEVRLRRLEVEQRLRARRLQDGP